MAIIAVLSVLIVGAITIAKRLSIETANRGNAKVLHVALESVSGKTKMRTYCPGGNIRCPGVWPDTTNASFTRLTTELRNQGYIDVGLNPAGTKTGAYADGGGVVDFYQSAIFIRICNWNCSSFLEEWKFELNSD